MESRLHLRMKTVKYSWQDKLKDPEEKGRKKK
jgi:hypothetical protein